MKQLTTLPPTLVQNRVYCCDHADKIIDSIVTMAHILEMTVIAEGMEMASQLARLTLYGCECIQGYLFSKPLPEVEAIRFLMENDELGSHRCHVTS